MAEMGLLPSLLTQIVGGAGASAVDRYYPNLTWRVGASPTDPGVSITPGAMAAVGTAVVLAVLPGKASASMAKLFFANLAGGALVYEGVKLAEDQILPRLEGRPVGMSALPGGAPGTLPPATQGVGAHLYPYAYRPTATDYEIQNALAHYRRAA